MVVLVNRRRTPVPRRYGPATSRATGPSFQQETRTTKVKTGDFLDARPFSGPEAQALKRKYGHYQFSAQGCIARALGEAQIRNNINRSQGTAPELVVLGDALLLGYRLGMDLFWQSATFRDPVFNPSGHSFPVDILKTPHGGIQWYEPVDGDHWHAAKATQILHDETRNAHLLQNGRGQIAVITDVECQSRESLRAYLDSKGAP